MIERRKGRCVLWSVNKTKAIFRHLGDAIEKKRLPGKWACKRCIRKSRSALDNRNWTTVNVFHRKFSCKGLEVKQNMGKSPEIENSNKQIHVPDLGTIVGTFFNM